MNEGGNMLYVYVRKDKKDKCYHVKNCAMLKKKRKKEPFAYKLTSIKSATQRGFKPCSKCKPDDIKHKLNLLKKVAKDSKKE